MNKSSKENKANEITFKKYNKRIKWEKICRLVEETSDAFFNWWVISVQFSAYGGQLYKRISLESNLNRVI